MVENRIKRQVHYACPPQISTKRRIMNITTSCFLLNRSCELFTYQTGYGSMFNLQTNCNHDTCEYDLTGTLVEMLICGSCVFFSHVT